MYRLEAHPSDRASQLGQSGLDPVLVVGDLIDLDAERDRLRTRLDRTEQDRERAEKKLANPGFRDKAPEDVVEAERRKVERFGREAASIREQLARLG